MTPIKYQGGPMKGQRAAYQDCPERILVRVPRFEKTWTQAFYDRMNDMGPTPVREGYYARSNRVYKNGTRVYIWMGYTDGKV